MPDKQKVIAALKETGVIAVIRADDASALIAASKVAIGQIVYVDGGWVTSL